MYIVHVLAVSSLTAPMCAGALQDAKQGHLVDHLPKNIGFGMGLEFREAINLLKPGNERRVAAGMVFNVAVGMSHDLLAVGSLTPDAFLMHA